MSEKKVKVIDVNVSIFEENDRIAAEVRAQNKANGTVMVNVMASPGAGKTTTLLRTIDVLIDGPFLLAQRSLELAFRGSRNQRILDVPASLAAGQAVPITSGRWLGEY